MDNAPIFQYAKGKAVKREAEVMQVVSEMITNGEK